MAKNRKDPIFLDNYSRKNWGLFRLLTLSLSLTQGILGPLFIIYFLHEGYSPAKIGTLLAVQAAIAVVLDIPTSIFADRLGRKGALLISLLFETILFLGWYSVHTFTVALIFSALWGISNALQSGVKSAWMVDTLQLPKHPQRTTIFSKIAVIGNIGLIIGGAIAAVVTHFGISYIWLASAGGSGISLVLASNITDSIPTTPRPHLTWQVFWIDLCSLIRLYTTKAPFPLLAGIETTTTIVLTSYLFLVPLFLRGTWNIPDASFGILGSLAAAAGVFGTLLSERLEKRHGLARVSIIFALLIPLAFLGLASAPFLSAVILFYLLGEALLFGWDPLEQSFKQQFLPSEIRASLLSVSSTLQLFVRSLTQFGIGFLLIIWQPQTALVGLAALLIFWPISISAIERRR